MQGFIKAAESEQVKEKSGLGIKIEGHAIALFRSGGKVYAYRDSCPHQAAPISDGYVAEGYIVCPHHNWKFNVQNGAFINNEIIRLPSYPVKEENGSIYIKL